MKTIIVSLMLAMTLALGSQVAGASASLRNDRARTKTASAAWRLPVRS